MRTTGPLDPAVAEDVGIEAGAGDAVGDVCGEGAE
jgi:hypothetical protein